MKRKLQRLVIAIFLFGASIVVGTVGFMVIEDFNLVEAFYMTIITMSTVGFTEVHELSENGRIFTAFFILLNLGNLTYVLSVTTSYIFDGGLKVILRTYMEERALRKLKGHVIVCGFGRNGSRASEELSASSCDFVIIEQNQAFQQQISDDKKWHLVIGDATQDEILKDAGIERASVIIITTPSDAANVFITLTARALNPAIKIISRASEKVTEGKLFRAGADKVIMPDIMGGMLMAQLVTKPVVIEFLDLLTGVSTNGEGYHLEEIGYHNLKPEFRDKSLKELNVREITGNTIIGMKDDKKGLIPGPSPETIVGPNDYMIVLGSHQSLGQFMRHFTTLTYNISTVE